MRTVKISFSEPKFVEHGTTTICILRGTFYSISIETVGVSRLSPSDTYDKNKGRRIAQAKAEIKAYKECLRINKLNTTRLLRHINAYEDFRIKANSVIVHNEKYIKSF